jgi:hypothetical protein
MLLNSNSSKSNDFNPSFNVNLHLKKSHLQPPQNGLNDINFTVKTPLVQHQSNGKKKHFQVNQSLF